MIMFHVNLQGCISLHLVTGFSLGPSKRSGVAGGISTTKISRPRLDAWSCLMKKDTGVVGVGRWVTFFFVRKFFFWQKKGMQEKKG